MPSKTEEYLALAQRTANGLTRYWESWTDYLTTASRLYKLPLCRPVDDLRPAPGCHRLRRLQCLEQPDEYISRLCSYPLLILDDFGMEQGTEYGLEQVYSVIDSRYRSGKPLIDTTNLTLEELQHPQDTPHARIYDRLTSMCAPVRFTGINFRKETAQEKLERLKQLMKQRKESL